MGKSLSRFSSLILAACLLSGCYRGLFAWDQLPSEGGGGSSADAKLYVADSGNHRIQVFDHNGGYLSEFGENGNGDGQFEEPSDVAVGPDGRLYVADKGNNRIQIFTAEGQFLQAFGDAGVPNGALQRPRGLDIDSSGKVYVADTENHRIQIFSAEGDFLDSFGSIGMSEGELLSPLDVAVGASGKIYVVEVSNNRYQVFSPSGVSLASSGFSLSSPVGIAVSADESQIFISTPSSHVVHVGDADGNELRVIGQSGSALGQFRSPEHLFLDSQQRLIIFERGNFRIQVWDSSGGALFMFGSQGSGPGEFQVLG